MDGDSAREVAGAWVRAHGNAFQQAQSAYEFLVRELMSLLPDDVDSGVVSLDGGPVVAAANDQSLFEIEPSVEDGEARVSCRRIALQPPPTIRLGERVRFKDSTTLRERDWTMIPPDDEPLTLVTLERLQAPFSSDQGPSPGEVALRRAVRAAGWSLPERDLGAEDYR